MSVKCVMLLLVFVCSIGYCKYEHTPTHAHARKHTTHTYTHVAFTHPAILAHALRVNHFTHDPRNQAKHWWNTWHNDSLPRVWVFNLIYLFYFFYQISWCVSVLRTTTNSFIFSIFDCKTHTERKIISNLPGKETSYCASYCGIQSHF